MSDVRTKILQCFETVFPDLPVEELPKASTASLAGWDSLAHITLLSVVAEEFSLEIAPEEYEALTSFALIEDFVQNHSNG